MAFLKSDAFGKKRCIQKVLYKSRQNIREGKNMKIKFIIIICTFILGIAVVLVSMKYNSDSTAPANDNIAIEQTDDLDTYDISININYTVSLDDKVKDVNQNIIKATRHAVVDNDMYFATLYHYTDYSINDDILIYDVKETGTDNWEVDFWRKDSSDAEYDTSVYQFATVVKEKSGSYTGYIFHSSPMISGNETY
jgi:hypothetical protein